MKQNKALDSIASARADAAAEELLTVSDFVRYGLSRFTESGLVYGHGTSEAMDEAAFMVLEGLNLPIDNAEPFWNSRLVAAERKKLARLIETRIETRKPASYLLNKAYIKGNSFYVDERVIIPRSLIADLLFTPTGFSRIPDYTAVHSVLDMCTGSGCLAILAALWFPNAKVDAVDLSPDALEVAKRNVADYGLGDRVTLHQGDLFAPLKGKTYDLIITNPPYVDKPGMDSLPPEFQHEPVMALAAGDDGMDIVHRLMGSAKNHLNDGGGMICELGRCGPSFDEAYTDKRYLWLSTESTEGEVFWIEKSDL